ncbi:hypothetical protein [Xylophilus sp. GOD-11R]|uniref:hypothetical protein n=1 Tax=Xylophilus sp. GOD-11R TaxID=3089814 RepID=UPI00298C0EB9|nr:hypothetical protein [Xylophilus sp. GOD-11R]WPB58656.1 hypothetical protein R9X41_08470 [Xylophilus sp. GOD-11R]
MSPLSLIVKVSATAWLCIVGGLIAIASVQTLRLSNAERDIAQLEAAAAKGTAARSVAYAADSDRTAGKEAVHHTSIQKASDDFTQAAPARAVDFSADLARTRRLLDSANDRAASYRAQAESGAAACSHLADRSTALDRQLAEGVGVVAELRAALERRDAEVALQGAVIDADRALFSPVEQPKPAIFEPPRAPQL